MSTRSYAIPALTALTIAATATGCLPEEPPAGDVSTVDPLVGDWVGSTWTDTFVGDDGTTMTESYSFNHAYGDAGNTYTRGLTLTLNEQLTGTMVSYYAYTYSDGTSSTESYSYALVGVPITRGQWDITGTGADHTLTTTCTADPELDTAFCESAPVPTGGGYMIYAYDLVRAPVAE